MTKEVEEILRDLVSLNKKLDMYRHKRNGPMKLREQELFWNLIESELERFWANSIILLPPESSGNRCPRCGHKL